MSETPFTAPLPEYVDARKVFSSEATISGFIAIARLERLSQSLAKHNDDVKVTLDFSVDSGGRRRITGHLSSTVWVTCQRCLEPAELILDEALDLVLVADEREALELDKAFDPWICTDHRIILGDLIDEQMLLGMPIVHYHASDDCADQALVNTNSDAGEESVKADSSDNNPFSVLADFKVKRPTQSNHAGEDNGSSEKQGDPR